LEAERDEAWQQAQNVANEYDQIVNNNNNNGNNENSATTSSSATSTSNRVSAKRKSCIRVSKAGLRTTISRRPSQRFSAGGGVGGVGGGNGSSSSARTPPLPLPIRRPLDILTDSPTSSNAFSAGFTPSSEARELAQVQDELYAMLGILNPDRGLHRSRSEIASAVSSPRCLSMSSVPRQSPNSAGGVGGADSPRMRYRRDSLPGALSLTEAYNVMSVDRNAVLATIDMLNNNSQTSATQVFSSNTAVPSSSF